MTDFMLPRNPAAKKKISKGALLIIFMASLALGIVADLLTAWAMMVLLGILHAETGWPVNISFFASFIIVVLISVLTITVKRTYNYEGLNS